MKKFIVVAKKSVDLPSGKTWWDDQTKEQQEQYIQDHPKSKYAIDAKEKELANSQRNPKSKKSAGAGGTDSPSPTPSPDVSEEPSVDSPTPPDSSDGGESFPESNVDDSGAEEEPLQIPPVEMDEEDEEVAKTVVRKKLSEMNMAEITDAIVRVPEDGEGFDRAHALAFGVCFLTALALVVAFPESAESFKILATQASNNYYEHLTGKSNTDKVENTSNAAEDKPIIKTTNEEKANSEERKINNGQLGFDENGNLLSDNAADAVTGEFAKKKGKTIL